MSETPQPAGKIGVMICTPKRSFRGAEDLPKEIGRALKELMLRGTPTPPVNTLNDIGTHDAWNASQTGNDVADAAFRAQASKYKFEFAAAVGGMCRARNTMVGEFLKTDNQFLIWWDDDLERADGFSGLAEVWLRMLSQRQPVVGCLYCARKKRPQWVTTWMPAAEYQPDANGLLQVAELSGGATLIHRKVFEELARIFGEDESARGSIQYRDRDTGEKLFGFYQNLVMDRDLLSEDYWFSYLCRCAKVPLLVDLRIRLRHVGPAGDGTGAVEVYPPGEFPPIPALEEIPEEIPEETKP